MFLHQHDPRILHSNLNPRNILLNEDASAVKIGDLGLAKYHQSNFAYLSSHSLLYFPPERFGKDANITAEGDIFSFGAVMLEVYTQEPPSCGLGNIGGKPEIERREDDLSKLSHFHPMKPMIVRCLDENPKKRPEVQEIQEKLLLIIRNPLNVGRIIAKGAYGEVREGSIGSRCVAVKQFHQILLDAAAENAQDLAAVLEDFRHECIILESAKNPHIVEFLGVLDEEVECSGELIVMELMHQTLEKYLEDHKRNVPLGKQLDIWYQVCMCTLSLYAMKSPNKGHFGTAFLSFVRRLTSLGDHNNVLEV